MVWAGVLALAGFPAKSTFAQTPSAPQGSAAIIPLWVSVNPVDKRVAVVLDLLPDQLRAAPQIQNDQWQMLQNPQFLERVSNFYQIRTYTAARPIDNAGMPAPCHARPLRDFGGLRIAAGPNRFLQRMMGRTAGGLPHCRQDGQAGQPLAWEDADGPCHHQGSVRKWTRIWKGQTRLMFDQ